MPESEKDKRKAALEELEAALEAAVNADALLKDAERERAEKSLQADRARTRLKMAREAFEAVLPELV